MTSSRPESREIDRRDFLRRAAMGTAGLALTSTLTGLPGGPVRAGDDLSRVVIVTDQAASSGITIEPDVAAVMMNRGVMELTGRDSAGQAWKSLFPGITSGSRIGIKVNCINRYLSSHPEIAQTIVDGLATMEVDRAPFPRNNIIVWDRHNYELTRAGYSIYYGSDPDTHRCFGTDLSGYSYDQDLPITIQGQIMYPSVLLTQHCDYLINLSVMKNHTMSGVTGSLKNHYGSIHLPSALHGASGQYCDPFIPDLNRKLNDQLGMIQAVNICDAIFGIASGGPMGNPQFAFNGLLFSRDPVALDYQETQILVDQGCGTATIATHIDTAAWPPYQLGTNDPMNMDVRYITDPSTGAADDDREPSRPADYRLELAYPNPFNAHTVIPYVIGGRSSVSMRVDIYNVRGQRVRALYRGRREPGRYRVVWDGRDDRGALLASGIYLCRLSAAGHEDVVKLSLIK